VFYDNFFKICRLQGMTPSRVLDQAKVSRGSLTRWKAGGEPLNEAKKRIADVLGVTVEELVTGEIIKPTDTRELSDQDYKTIEDFKQLTDENKALVAALIAKLKQNL
jgi:transcriptional regulator with XRE-family HTH domain